MSDDKGSKTEKAKEELEDAADKAKEKAEKAAEKTADKTRDAAAKAKKTSEEAAEQVKETSRETAEHARETAEGYVGHVKAVLTGPDLFFDANHRDSKTNALIDLVGFGVVFFLAAVVGRTFGYAGFDFDFGHILDGLKAVLAIGIPIGALLFLWNLQGKRRGLDFYMEKFGAALVLPCLLLIVAIVLDVLDIRIQSWFRGLAVAFIYVGVFATTYAYAAPGKLRAAVVFTAGFYLAYRLLAMLF